MKYLETLRKLATATRGALFALAVSLALASLLAGPVLATVQTITPQNTRPPRVLPEQSTHYVRYLFKFSDCQLRAADTACSIRIGSLPYNAFLVAISKQIITTFNPTTSATVALGTTAQGTDLMAAFNVFTAQATTAVYDTGFAAAGEAVTGNGAAQTGSAGGFDVWATYTVGAAGSQGTQGQLVLIIQYIAPNDGNCFPVPIGSTAVAC